MRGTCVPVTSKSPAHLHNWAKFNQRDKQTVTWGHVLTHKQQQKQVTDDHSLR